MMSLSLELLLIYDPRIGLTLMGIGRNACLLKTKLGSLLVEIAKLLGIKGGSSMAIVAINDEHSIVRCRQRRWR